MYRVNGGQECSVCTEKLQRTCVRYKGLMLAGTEYARPYLQEEQGKRGAAWPREKDKASNIVI